MARGPAVLLLACVAPSLSMRTYDAELQIIPGLNDSDEMLQHLVSSTDLASKQVAELQAAFEFARNEGSLGLQMDSNANTSAEATGDSMLQTASALGPGATTQRHLVAGIDIHSQFTNGSSPNGVPEWGDDATSALNTSSIEASGDVHLQQGQEATASRDDLLAAKDMESNSTRYTNQSTHDEDDMTMGSTRSKENGSIMQSVKSFVFQNDSFVIAKNASGVEHLMMKVDVQVGVACPKRAGLGSVGCMQGCSCDWFEKCYPKTVQVSETLVWEAVGTCGVAPFWLISLSLGVFIGLLTVTVVMRLLFQYRDTVAELRKQERLEIEYAKQARAKR